MTEPENQLHDVPLYASFRARTKSNSIVFDIPLFLCKRLGVYPASGDRLAVHFQTEAGVFVLRNQANLPGYFGSRALTKGPFRGHSLMSGRIEVKYPTEAYEVLPPHEYLSQVAYYVDRDASGCFLVIDPKPLTQEAMCQLKPGKQQLPPNATSHVAIDPAKFATSAESATKCRPSSPPRRQLQAEAEKPRPINMLFLAELFRRFADMCEKAHS